MKWMRKSALVQFLSCLIILLGVNLYWRLDYQSGLESWGTSFYESHAARSVLNYTMDAITNQAAKQEEVRLWAQLPENAPVSAAYASLSPIRRIQYLQNVLEMNLAQDVNSFETAKRPMTALFPDEFEEDDYPIYTKKAWEAWSKQGIQYADESMVHYVHLGTDGSYRSIWLLKGTPLPEQFGYQDIQEEEEVPLLVQSAAPIGYASLVDFLENRANVDYEEIRMSIEAMLQLPLVQGKNISADPRWEPYYATGTSLQLDKKTGYPLTNVGVRLQFTKDGPIYSNLKQESFKNADWTAWVYLNIDGTRDVSEGAEKEVLQRVLREELRKNTGISKLPGMRDGIYSFEWKIDRNMTQADPLRASLEQYPRDQILGWIGLLLFLGGGLLWLLSLLLYFWKTSPHENERWRRFEEQIPVEILLFLLFQLLLLAAFYIGIVLTDAAQVLYSGTITGRIVTIGFEVIGILTLEASGLYLSGCIMRKIKGQAVWKTSLLYRSLQWILNFLGNSVYLLETNRSWTVLSLGIPFLFLFFVFAIFGWGREHVVLILLFLAGFIFYARHWMQRETEKTKLLQQLQEMGEGNLECSIQVEDYPHNRSLAEHIIALDQSLTHALDRSLKNERMQNDLITHVTHDLRTPVTVLTSYLDLLKKSLAQPTRDEAQIQDYLDILEKKVARLRTLIDDLLQASQASSGEWSVDMRTIQVQEFLSQLQAEYEDRWQERALSMVIAPVDPQLCVHADGETLLRILSNLWENAWKYAQKGTRIYFETYAEEGKVRFVMKNVSAQALNIPAEKLMQRFQRGDTSRSSEGSGLGLYIAENLAKCMGGMLNVHIDGDLFRTDLVLNQADCS